MTVAAKCAGTTVPRGRSLLGGVTLLIMVLLQNAAIAETKAVKSLVDATEYLEKYQYIGQSNPDPKMASLSDPATMSRALQMFQTQAAINVTGRLDEDTRRMMQTPRCGMPDIVRMSDMSRRKKRYTLSGSRWERSKNNPLTYYFKNHTPQLPWNKVEDIVDRAFYTWSTVADIHFLKLRGPPADIEVSFGRYQHGDPYSFDGRGGTLAHAFFPQSGGDAHFDEDERWTDGVDQGTNLFFVAVHELGHSLGLGHSQLTSAIMYPFYQGYTSDFHLGLDDIQGLQRLYGPKVVDRPSTPSPVTPRPTAQPTIRPSVGVPTRTPRPPTPSPSPSPSPSNPDLDVFCKWATFDAITTFNGETYAFKRHLVAKLGRDGVVAGYPKRIFRVFPGLPDNIDAAIHWNEPDKRILTYFFKGQKYWRYEMSAQGEPLLAEGYPKYISQGWPGIPSDLDAVFVWSGNGQTYFVKGDLYYRWSRYRGVDPYYPRSMDAWSLPMRHLDAAYEWNDHTYFFDKRNYIRFNDQDFAVDSANPPYPRSIVSSWLNCPGSPGGIMEMMQDSDDIKNILVDPDLNSGAAALVHKTCTLFVLTFFWSWLTLYSSLGRRS